MAVTIVNLQDAIRIARITQHVEPQVTKNFFDVFGTTGCLLNCEAERTLQQNFPQNRTTHVARSKRERRQVRVARKAYHNQHRQSRQDWFTADEIAESVAQGCGSCSVLSQIIHHLFSENQQSLFATRGCGPCRVLSQTIQRLFPAKYQSLSNTHEYSFSQDDNTRPARLLDMSGCCRSGIRLIETKSGTSYQYACLSHRWDNAVADHKTTTENLPSRLSSLALRKLPVNFRDAVSIARGLNIKYLWIDSICIIQDGDNGADLNRELAKMGFIYQNAHLTIVAVSSSDSSGGCFPRPASDVCFSVPNNTQDDYLIGARVLDKKGHAVSIDDINAHYPLLTRGWVFQEVLLSPWIVLCNYGEFTFECRGSSRCECNSSIAPHPTRAQTSTWLGHLDFVDRQRLRPLTDALPQDALDAYREQAMNFWREIVLKYSQLKLTYSFDVLPAIGGCAQALAHNLQFKYIAGMWEEILHVDLLWYVLPQKRYAPKPRPKDTTAPSWSWASVSMGQAVTHIDPKSPYLINHVLLQDAIKEHHYQPNFLANPFGKMNYAYLKLDAKLYPWYLRSFCRTAQHHWNRRHPVIDLFINRPHDSVNCTAHIQELMVNDVGVQTYLDARLADERLVFTHFSNCIHSRPADQCGLAQIYLLHALHREARVKSVEMFLVLMRIQSVHGRANCYQRIGLIMLTDEGTSLRTWDRMIQGQITSQPGEFWLF